MLEGNLGICKIREAITYGTLSETLNLYEISTVASVVNLVRPTTVASLSHCACVQHDMRGAERRADSSATAKLVSVVPVAVKTSITVGF